MEDARGQIASLIGADADELIIAGHLWDPEAHRRSLTLTARAAGLG